MIRWPSGRIVIVPSASAALATGGAWTTPRISATPVFMCSRVESACTLMSNENGCCLPGSRSHSTVPAIVSAKEKPMPKPTPKTPKRARRPATTFSRERERQLHLGHALREREALAGAAGVTRVTGRAVGLVAVDAGVLRQAVRGAVEAVRFVVDVLADRRGRALAGRLALAVPAAVREQRDIARRAGRRLRRAARVRRAAAGAGRVRAVHAGRARLVAVRVALGDRLGVVRAPAGRRARVVLAGLTLRAARVGGAARVRAVRAAVRRARRAIGVAVIAGTAVRVGRAEAALVTRAVGAVAAGGAVRRGRALVAAAATGAGSRAGR